VLGGSSGRLLFQSFFDITESLVEEDEIEENGVSAFNQASDLILMCLVLMF
jgi:hypothetical protein